jgi:glycoprotein-N-acetylgalactosamine 3-beta-galactosyltransferase
MGGGAGYVLSKAALMRFVEDGLKNKTKCREENDGFEDVEMGLCMQNLGVIAGNSRDQENKETFFSYQPEMHLDPGLKQTQPWLEQFWYYQQMTGFNCCSNHAISFHYIHPIDYLLYHVQPYGLRNMNPKLPNKLTISEILANLSQNKSSIPVTWNVTAEFGDYDYGYRFRYQKEPE